MTVTYGMAVLVIRVLFVIVSYRLLEKINWKKVLKEKEYVFAQFICWMISIAVGHLVASFFITTMELMRDILFSIFL